MDQNAAINLSAVNTKNLCGQHTLTMLRWQAKPANAMNQNCAF